MGDYESKMMEEIERMEKKLDKKKRLDKGFEALGDGRYYARSGSYDGDDLD